MARMTRRAWLTAIGLTPVVGGLMAWVKNGSEKRDEPTRQKLSPRERIQRDHLPNVELVTHEGKRVRFYDELTKDKKFAVNFFLTQCPDGTCPLTTANLVQVQKLLKGRVGRDFFFYSITLDPKRDTPEALKEYAKRFGVGPGWLFLTGKPEDIERVRRGLSNWVDPADNADVENHTGMVRIATEPVMFWAGVPGMANPQHILRIMLWEFDRPLPKNI